jgi:hypothetical protein
MKSLGSSLTSLMDESSIRVSEQITANAVTCALSWPIAETTFFDRKYSVYNTTAVRYEPVYPIALLVYRTFFFWNDILKYVNDKEQDYLQMCAVRGWLFEGI